ncbi:toxic anion resistance protein [Sphingomonas morindae]|uniref:Toxic anion resistance protein n=1 Tax=Sphingomonas morindae TaxID=1541170 RepID=A0ABY4X6W6_9SPHN|nr:toxic anion resistance protein [Sphingomonas morindae]USI72674.1 toxic anion resistance protein [Sphingomonas morindae]
MATEPTTLDAPIELTPPAPVPVLPPERAAGLVPLSEGQRSKLDQRVDGFIAELVAADSQSPEFGRKVDQITNMGRREIQEAAGHSNRFLDRPVKAMDKDSSVGADLAALRRTIEDLDPGRQGNLLAPKKLFGMIPFGSKMRDYFDGYKSAQSHIATILARLASGKDELLKDNAAIDVERQSLWQAMGRLEQMIHIAKTLDARLEDKASELDGSDPAKAKAIRESALFYVRQRSQDLLTQMAVTVQGYLALDLVKKNNVELIKGVDRASTTTVAALRTAVTVAQALTSQKLVLEQITALNTTTANIIDSTGALLKSQTAQIHQQAAASTIPIDTLKRAFQNIYQTMDAIDTFKLQALDTMKQTVGSLTDEVEKSRGYIARAEGAAQAQLSARDEAFKLD